MFRAEPAPAHTSRSAARRARVPFLLRSLVLLVSLAAPAGAAYAQAPQALQFDGVNDYVTFGAAPALGASTFTLEVRFKRTGTGVTTSTGTGGVTAVPLLTKGRGEGDGSVVDMNYFLGIRTTDNVLVADYEEGTGQASPGLNHPVAGTTAITSNVWHHAAASFDGATWRLYLDGNLEATLVVGASRLPQSASTQHAGLGTAMTSAGAAAGFFAGLLDEARVWNLARTQGEIQAAMGGELMAGAGLIARWGLNEGTGASAGNSMAGSVNGTLTNGPIWSTDSTVPLSAESGLRFGGTNAWVTFGDASALKLGTFTLETWFRRDGPGTTTTTGTGGVTNAVPLLAKGRGENENPAVDLNYLLGIRASDQVLVADFEEGAAGSSPSLNHPVIGVTPIVNGVWYHAAATYDGATWKLYLNGGLEAELAVGQPPAAAGTQHASLATGLTSTGVAEGFFHGALDEARIWNTARTQPEIQAAMNSTLAGPQDGLVARWGLDEDAQLLVHSSAGVVVDGTVSGSNWSWAAGAPFDATPPVPPSAPSDLTATAAGSSAIDLAWTDNSGNETSFEISRSTTGIGGAYTPRASVAANTVAWTDAGLDPETEYCYRVHAMNGAGASGDAGPVCASTPAAAPGGLDFSGSAYVTFGDPAALDLAQFTVECWFRRDGTGTTVSTGSGGVTTAIPLVTKGTSEADGSSVDMNWFLGIDDATDRLMADFEEGAGGTTPGLNHPVIGATTIATGVWHHAAATYDGATWNLYLDGNLEATLAVGQPCQSQSTQHAALASSIRSNGTTAQGFLEGALDEVRVWNFARTQLEIQGTANAQLAAPAAGLVARWGLDEGSGAAVGGSAGTTVHGAIVGAVATWISPGAPFDLDLNMPPGAPALAAPAHLATGVALAPSLEVGVTDPDGGDLTVNFYGRALAEGAPGPDFTLIGQPDTQYYTGELNGGSDDILIAINAWIAAQRASRGIAYVATLGDCVESGDNGGDDIQWQRASGAYALLEDPLTTGLADGIPYGITVGNHDQSPNGDPSGTTTFYNQYFGESRFLTRAYYGGHYGSDNDNWYDLFSAGGLDFIVVSFEYDTTPDAAVLGWADQLLATHAGRRAIVLSHNLCGTGNPATFSAQGSATYAALRHHPNLFLMMAGHVAGEGRRQDTYNGATVNTLMSDYQSRTNGGNGWIRILTFSPAANTIEVETYSPWLDQFETDADSRFTLAYDMSDLPAFEPLGSVAGVAGGTSAAIEWSGLLPNTTYEWYVTVSDGQATTTGPVWRFTTTPDGVPPVVTVLAPNGGQALPVDSHADLTWTATDNTGVTSVDVLLSRTGAGGPFESLASDLANSGSFAWTVTGPATADAFLKVVARDAAGNPGEDLSDAAFGIVPSATAVGEGLPAAFGLEPVVPNPARGGVQLVITLPRAAEIRLAVHDLQGREVARLADGAHAGGRHAIPWNGLAGGGALPAGLYFVQFITPEGRFQRRVVLIP